MQNPQIAKQTFSFSFRLSLYFNCVIVKPESLTREKDEDFDSFVVLFAAVCVLTVHGIAGELPSVRSSSIGQNQCAVAIVLNHSVCDFFFFFLERTEICRELFYSCTMYICVYGNYDCLWKLEIYWEIKAA